MIIHASSSYRCIEVERGGRGEREYMNDEKLSYPCRSREKVRRRGIPGKGRRRREGERSSRPLRYMRSASKKNFLNYFKEKKTAKKSNQIKDRKMSLALKLREVG